MADAPASMDGRASRKGRPLLLGCLALALLPFLYVGVCWLIAQYRAGWVQHITDVNITAEANRRLAGIPLFPGARVDAPATRERWQVVEAAREFQAAFTLGRVRETGDPLVGLFTASAPSRDVAAWYDAQMPAAGWTLTDRDTPAPGVETRSYERTGELLLLNVKEGATPGTSSFTPLWMRF